MKPIIRLQNVHVVYDEGGENQVAAVQDVSLEIYPGEYVIFFGPSGSGKSTLLYTIAGLELAAQGTVEVGGHELHAVSEEGMIAFHRSTIGMVFQAFYLIPHYTVLDNVCLPHMFTTLSRAAREAKARTLIERFGLSTISQHTPARMSGGQQQRAAIARALMNDPQIILADEPVGNLDSKNATIVLDLLARINAEERRTIIQVTHNIEDLVYADRIFHMRDGRIERIEINQNKRGAGYRKEEATAREQKIPQNRVWAERIAHELLRPYDQTTEALIQKSIEQFLEGTITKIQLQKIFDDKTGANLNAQTARHLSSEVAELVEDMRHAQSIATGDMSQEITHATIIRAHLVAHYHPHLTDTQKESLDALVRARLEKKLSGTDFLAALDTSVKKGGVGLNTQTAHAIAKKLDGIMMT